MAAIFYQTSPSRNSHKEKDVVKKQPYFANNNYVSVTFVIKSIVNKNGIIDQIETNNVITTFVKP